MTGEAEYALSILPNVLKGCPVGNDTSEKKALIHDPDVLWRQAVGAVD